MKACSLPSPIPSSTTRWRKGCREKTGGTAVRRNRVSFASVVCLESFNAGKKDPKFKSSQSYAAYIDARLRDGSLKLDEVSLAGLADLSKSLSLEPDRRKSSLLLEEVASTVRLRLANKNSSSVQRWELQGLSELLEAFVAAGHRRGQAASMFDKVASAVARLLKTGSVRLPEQGVDLLGVLRQLHLTRHRSIAVSDLLVQLAHQLRMEIAHVFGEHARGGTGASNGWYGDRDEGEILRPEILCKLLAQFHDHGYHPGQMLLDAAGTYLACCGMPLEARDVSEFCKLLATYRHHPGDRLLQLFLRQGASEDVCSSPEGIRQAVMVLTCSAELGAYSLPSFRKSAAPLVPKALYALDWAEPADSPKQNSLATRPLYSHVAGPCAAPPAAAPFQDLCDLLWSLSLADALEEDGFASACSALQQTGIQPESIHPRALVRLIQAAQLCCLHRGTSPAEDALRGLLGDRLASACLQAQQQHVQRTCSSFSVDHVGMMPAVSKMSRDGCSSQVHLDRGLYADFILKIRGRQVAVAVEGVSDRLSNMPEVPMATAHVRRRLLSGAGFLVVPISQTEWRRRDHEDRERYVQDCVSSVSAQSASSGGMQ